MNYSNVKTLYYKVRTADGVDYDNVSPVVEETEYFEIHIDKGTVVFHLKRMVNTIEEAKALAEEYLKNWEVLIGIEHHPDELSFTFERADIDTASDIQHTLRSGASYILVNTLLRCRREKFPSRPTKFRLSPDVETMYVRYKAYKQGREPLTSMAYMCLKVLEVSASNKRSEAAEKFNISDNLLQKLGKLANRGGPTEVRKAPKNGKYIPLKSTEKIWMESVVKAIIRRAGEWAYEPTAKLPQLAMADFPSLQEETKPKG